MRIPWIENIIPKKLRKEVDVEIIDQEIKHLAKAVNGLSYEIPKIKDERVKMNEMIDDALKIVSRKRQR